MARIDFSAIKKIEKTRNTIHEPVPTTYTVFTHGTDKFVQVDMYGRTDRENPEKISQSFQFDRESAKYLVNLLVREFDLR